MVTSHCPDQQILKQLLSGRLNDEQAAPLETHLLRCERCVETVASFVEDEDLAAAHRVHELLSNDNDEIIEQVIERVKKMRAAADTVEVANTLAAGVPAGSVESSIAASRDKDEPDIRFLAPAQHPDELGRLGDYRVLQVLGVGGMGIVFRAEDPRLKRQAALKVMKPSIASSGSAKERFLREAQFNASIEHDNIVHIYQVGEDRNVPFIAMQYLRGESLKHRLQREGKLRQSDVVRIGKEIAAGLAAAHKQGLIHRDIKPDNIWLEAETDRAKILDFGLVRAVAEETGLTMTGMVVGTPQYMAPEQALGQPVDHRCDLFSLGSVLYQLATGKRAFKGANVTATLMAVVHQEPAPIELVSPQIHPALSALITKLLSKDPDDRPQTAVEVSRALNEIEQDFQLPATVEHVAASLHVAFTPATPATASPPFKKPPRKRFLLAAAGGAVALVLLGAIIITITSPDGTQTKIRIPEGSETDVQAAPGSKVTITQNPGHKKKEQDLEAMRDAAAWILSRNGKITGIGSGVIFFNADEVPSGQFQLWGARWEGESITPSDLRRLQPVKSSFSMAHLNLQSVGPQHLDEIAKLPNIDILHLQSQEAVTFSKLQLLTLLHSLPNLWGLRLINLPVSGEELLQLPQLGKLLHFGLGGSPNQFSQREVDATTITAILQMAKLKSLDLSYSRVRTDLISDLGKLDSLRELAINGTDLPAANFGNLIQNLAFLEVNEVDLTPEHLACLAEQKTLRWLSIKATGITQDQFEALCDSLTNCQIISDFGKAGPPPPSTPLRGSWWKGELAVGTFESFLSDSQ